ncbi:MAG: tetratricopeptide repeat protein [Hyphomonadaceae bacterium]
MRRWTVGLIAALAAALAATPAQAAVTVVGGGMARDCYEAVDEGGQIGPALEMCNLALEQERLTRRDRAATLVNRGILRMRQASFEAAMRDYEESLRLEPNLMEAQVNLGAALYGLKRYPEALVALNEGIKSEDLKARAVAYYNRALTQEHLGQVEEAYYDFKQALALDPDFDDASRQLDRFQVVASPSPES